VFGVPVSAFVLGSVVWYRNEVGTALACAMPQLVSALPSVLIMVAKAVAVAPVRFDRLAGSTAATSGNGPKVKPNTPPPVPAYSADGSRGSTARALTLVWVRPVLIALQVPPPSVLLNTPPSAPAYRVLVVSESMARAVTLVLVRPVLLALQLPPPLVLLNTPPPFVPA
jgi:hypothetical protein